MSHVTLRTRTADGVMVGSYTTADPDSLMNLEDKHKALRALEQAIHSSELMVNPFMVTEASVACNNLTYRYTIRKHPALATRDTKQPQS